jgi:transglutaminase-like putative cysteine protease
MSRLPGLRLLVLALALVPAGAAEAAVEFRAIAESEKKLASIPEHPNAPAVVLFKQGLFLLIDPASGQLRPTLEVTVRRKILTEEGKRYGEVVLHHSKRVRLQRVEARTVLPDGRVIPVPEKAMFRRRTSHNEKTFETALAFPAVEVGAILDYRYKIETGGFLFEPWYFQEDVPTLYSEVVFELPEILVTSAWRQDPMRVGLQENAAKTLGGYRITAWGNRLPAVPDEPHGPSFAEMAARYMVIPVSVRGPAGKTPLFSDWASTCDRYAKVYAKSLRKARDAGRRARELTAAVPGGGRRERARALYRFVRDEIETVDLTGVGLPEDSTADSVLTARRGDPTEKALLLQALLAAIDIEARLVWVTERAEGPVNLQFFTPLWFDRAILALDLDGQRVYLDPSDRSLGFGRLPPGIEGMPALLYDPKEPQVIDRMPVSPFAENLRRAEIALDLDAEGRLAGRGTLRLTGHHAWSYLGWRGDDGDSDTNTAWQDWIEDAFPGFAVQDVQAKEDFDAQRVEVAWTLRQRDEEVLGDETTLTASRPLGPAAQPFQDSAERRQSPILFPFGDRDEVELTLSWPEGWSPESLPRPLRHDNAVGAALVEVQVNEGDRSLTYRRRVDIPGREYGKSSYEALQTLFAETEKSDAESVVLVRR